MQDDTCLHDLSIDSSSYHSNERLEVRMIMSTQKALLFFFFFFFFSSFFLGGGGLFFKN